MRMINYNASLMQPRVRARFARDMNRRVARDITPNVASQNTLPPSNPLSSFGWMGTAIGAMGNMANWAYSMNPDNTVIVGGSLPLETLATTPAALLNACYIAAQGQAGKTFIAAAWATAELDLALTANSAAVFGARIRVTNSVTTFKFSTYELILSPNSTLAGGSNYSYVLVEAVSLPVDVILLSISNAAGKATIVTNATPYVIVPYSATAGAIGNVNKGALAAGDVIYAESLNMRDIGNILAAAGSGALTI